MRCATVLLSLTFMALISIQSDAQPRNSMAATENSSSMVTGRHMMMRDKMSSGGMMPCNICSPWGTGWKRGMHRGMPGCELHRFMNVIYRLPDLEAQLDLSRDQISRLNDQQSTFLKNKADWRAEIEKKRIDLNHQLENRAESSRIRRTLESISKVMVDMKVSGYETALEMLTVLNSEQKRKWSDFCSSCQPHIMQ